LGQSVAETLREQTADCGSLRSVDLAQTSASLNRSSTAAERASHRCALVRVSVSRRPGLVELLLGSPNHLLHVGVHVLSNKLIY
jgi:hypothetical protein